MRRIGSCIYFYLLVLGLPGIGRAGEAYPQVQVVARVNGQIFEDIAKPELEKLRHEVEAGVAGAFGGSFPCMEWVPEESGSKANVRARLFIDLFQRKYKEFSWIDLHFNGAAGNSQPVPLWTIFGVSSTLDRSWSLRRLKGLKDQILRATTAELQKQELRKTFDSSFIASIPIAYSIRVDPPGHRIIVPLDFRRLNLEPETLLKLMLVAPLCPGRPEEWCKMGLMSEGPGAGRFQGLLRCRIAKMGCCPLEDWPPGFADRLATRKVDTVRVYLAESHRHCRYGPDNCPGPDEIYRHPGF